MALIEVLRYKPLSITCFKIAGLIGGTSHELGHCMGLPHGCQTVKDWEERGTSIMGSGNYLFAEELRGEGKGEFIQ